MRSQTRDFKQRFCTAIVIVCAVLVADQVQAQNVRVESLYSISASTAFGDNGVNAGTEPTTFKANLNQTLTLANGTNSGDNNAVFIESSDGGSVSTLLGRTLNAGDTIVVGGTISSATVNYSANGIEFGLQGAPGFRTQPNMLIQVDDAGSRGGFAPFFGTPNPGLDVNRTQIPGVTEASLNDGYSFQAVYTSTDIIYTISDIVTTNETGVEPVGATSFSFSFADAVAADTTLQGALDDYVANFPTLVGDSYAYFSAQKTGDGNATTISRFYIHRNVLLGDVNSDGEVNFLDIQPFIAVISSGGYSSQADIDRCGKVNFLDIQPFLRILMNGA